MLQAYPAGGGSLADAMAANELAAHCSLRAEGDGQHVCSLIGGFASERGRTAGEQVPGSATVHPGVTGTGSRLALQEYLRIPGYLALLPP